MKIQESQTVLEPDEKGGNSQRTAQNRDENDSNPTNLYDISF